MVELSPKQAWYTGSTKQVVTSLQVRTGRGPVYFCFSQSEKNGCPNLKIRESGGGTEHQTGGIYSVFLPNWFYCSNPPGEPSRAGRVNGSAILRWRSGPPGDTPGPSPRWACRCPSCCGKRWREREHGRRRRASANVPGRSRAGCEPPARRQSAASRPGARPGPRGRRAPAAHSARGGPRCRRGVRRLCAPSHNPPYGYLTPHRPHPLRILTSRRPSTNLEHAVCARNLPNQRSLNRLRQTMPA